MQKDVHFYLTYAIGLRIGLPEPLSRKIAWANQYTDDNVKAELHGMRTQCAIYKDWADRTVQQDIIVPFHFIPGNGDWLVAPGSDRARGLVEKALDDPFRLGIALHALQDTYSHQSFTGWEEKVNAVYWFDRIDSPIPNVGHAEVRKNPDIANLQWKDHRSGEWIDNRQRVIAAAWATHTTLKKLCNRPKMTWPAMTIILKSILEIEGRTAYDKRKTELQKFAGSDVRYGKLPFQKYKPDFIKAARCHLGDFFGTLG